MSDYLNSNSMDDEIDAILSEVRGEGADEAPSKDWSMADIDRLIAQTNGEEYEEEAPAGETAHQKYSRFFTSEFNEDIFTVQPMEEEKPEIEDIFSGVAEEVDGQETFYPDGEDDFDPNLFELETVIMPEDSEYEDISSVTPPPRSR